MTNQVPTVKSQIHKKLENLYLKLFKTEWNTSLSSGFDCPISPSTLALILQNLLVFVFISHRQANLLFVSDSTPRLVHLGWIFFSANEHYLSRNVILHQNVDSCFPLFSLTFWSLSRAFVFSMSTAFCCCSTSVFSLKLYTTILTSSCSPSRFSVFHENELWTAFAKGFSALFWLKFVLFSFINSLSLL